MKAFDKSTSSNSSSFAKAPKFQSKLAASSPSPSTSSQRNFVAQAKQPDVVPMEVDSG